ncbi:19225_t:CDS:2, partial [Gigaspora rosea]
LIDEMVGILTSFEEITRHFSELKYPTINLIYLHVCMLKNKYAPVVKKESSDQDTSISSSDEDSILSAENRKQW